MSTFGSDISTLVGGDLDPTFTVISGPRVVGEAMARRLTTPPGSLPDNPAYGYNLHDLLEEDFDDQELGAAKASVLQQIEADERVLTASILTFDLAGETLRLRVRLVTSEGPFTLTLSVSHLSTSLIFEP